MVSAYGVNPLTSADTKNKLVNIHKFLILFNGGRRPLKGKILSSGYY